MRLRLFARGELNPHFTASRNFSSIAKANEIRQLNNIFHPLAEEKHRLHDLGKLWKLTEKLSIWKSLSESEKNDIKETTSYIEYQLKMIEKKYDPDGETWSAANQNDTDKEMLKSIKKAKRILEETFRESTAVPDKETQPEFTPTCEFPGC